MRPSRLASVLLFAGGLVAIVSSLAAGSLAQTPQPPVQPVATVDLDRYVGRWYEIARFPNRFQKKCTGNVVVYYAKRDDGRIDVRNTCGTADGAIEATGVARRADEDGPSSILEVRFAPAILSFIPAVWGDYWILGLAPDYSTAVVGSPDREYLWFLARTPEVDQATWARMIETARSQGFDVDRIERTKQDTSE
jgi:apolipoprotein D and lipocalin family protein